MKAAKSIVCLGVIGLDHGHVDEQVDLLYQAEAFCASFYTREECQAAEFFYRYPGVPRVEHPFQLVEDPSLQFIVSALVPDQRSTLGCEVMRAGRDFFVDKPACVTVGQLQEVRRVAQETGRMFVVFFGEDFCNPATLAAASLVAEGVIGWVVQTIGLGPHRSRFHGRPEWFFDPARSGSILVDIASHQIEQFLFLPASRRLW